MTAVQQYSRYGAIVGVYPELHPSLFRLASLLARKGTYGLGYVVQFMNAAIEAEGTESRFSNTEHHFVSMLYAVHTASPQRFTQDDIRFHIVPSIGGGSDTTAITLGAVLYHLIKSPSVMYRLRQELDGKRGKREFSWPVKLKEAQDSVYLQAVIKETMRIYPGNGLPLPRIIPEGGLTIAGRHFPAGVRWIHLSLPPCLSFSPSFFGPSDFHHDFEPKKSDIEKQLADNRRHQRLGRQLQQRCLRRGCDGLPARTLA